MATCNQILQAQGAIYPKSCAKCGLGKCTERKSADEPMSGSLKQIAGLIQKLSYRDMGTLATKLSEAFKEGDELSAPTIAQAMLDIADDILKDA